MNRQSRRKAIVVLVLFLAATCVARADEIDDFIRAEMQRQNIPGLSFAVIRDGNIIKAEGYGLADIKLKMPAQAGTIFKIASVSKQFIATGIMLLVQEAQLDLDDPISRYLEGTPATWKGITIRHLLTHTSGLVREGPGFDARKIQSDADVIKSAYSLPLRFAPGEKWEYCNLGYFALAEIIRKVSGRPWTEYLNEKVFRPSGMSTTYPTNTKVELPNRAQGYVDNAKLLEADEWVALRPSGAFLSTVLDMAKWDAVLYTDKVLSESSRQAMWTPVKLNDGATYPYGFGWYVGSIRGRKLVHHGGGGPGARAWFARFVDDRLTVILLMNLDDVDPESIVHGVAAFYLRAPTVDLAKDYRVIEWTAGATARVITAKWMIACWSKVDCLNANFVALGPINRVLPSVRSATWAARISSLEAGRLTKALLKYPRIIANLLSSAAWL